MRKFTAIVVAAAALLASSAAVAATVYSNNFDAEAGGATVLNYNAFNGLTVSLGVVDLLGPGNVYGLPCVTGSCVDLDGSRNQAGRLTTGVYNFNAGETITLSFDLAGNHRNSVADSFQSGFIFGGATQLLNATVGGAYGSSNFGNLLTGSWTHNGNIAGSAAYANYTISFTAGQAGSLQAFVGASGTDNVGPLLDNFGLVSIGVPEPATWAMMIMGFGAAGSMIRRRRAVIAS